MVSARQRETSIVFREYRSGKTPCEITLDVRGLFATTFMPWKVFARFCKAQGTAGSVPRVRALMDNCLDQTGITRKRL